MPALEHVRDRQTSETLHNIAREVIELLMEAGETVSVVESLEGGSVMSAITSVPGSSAAFRGGVFSYSTDLKQTRLGVDPVLIATHGVIHGDVARQMAAGIRTITSGDNGPTTWAIGTTGVAGPDTQDGHPGGTVYIAIVCALESHIWGPFCFSGSRDKIQDDTALVALVQLRTLLQGRTEMRSLGLSW